jgi:hypothetical protein
MVRFSMMHGLKLFIYLSKMQVFIQNLGQACDTNQIPWIKICSIPTIYFQTGKHIDQFLHSKTFHNLFLTLRPNTMPYGMSQDNA